MLRNLNFRPPKFHFGSSLSCTCTFVGSLRLRPVAMTTPFTGQNFDGRRPGRGDTVDIRGLSVARREELTTGADARRTSGYKTYKQNTTPHVHVGNISRPKPYQSEVLPPSSCQRSRPGSGRQRRRHTAPTSAERARRPERKSSPPRKSSQRLRPAQNERAAPERGHSNRTRSPRKKGRGRSRPVEMTRKHHSHERDRRGRPRGQPSWISETNSVPIGAMPARKKHPLPAKHPLTTMLGQVGPAFIVVQLDFEDLSTRGKNVKKRQVFGSLISVLNSMSDPKSF